MGREEGGGFRMGNVYLWRIHFDIWQNQYNIVKLKNKIKRKQLKKKIKPFQKVTFKKTTFSKVQGS